MIGIGVLWIQMKDKMFKSEIKESGTIFIYGEFLLYGRGSSSGPRVAHCCADAALLSSPQLGHGMSRPPNRITCPTAQVNRPLIGNVLLNQLTFDGFSTY